MAKFIKKIRIINDLDVLVYIKCSDNTFISRYINFHNLERQKYGSLGLLPGESIEIDPKNDINLKDSKDSNGIPGYFTITIEEAYPKGKRISTPHTHEFYYYSLTDITITIKTSNNEIPSGVDNSSKYVKRLELHAVTGVGYKAKFRIYFKKPGCGWDYRTSKTFPLGKHKYWDCIEELHLPDETEVRPAVCSVRNLITDNVHKEKQHDDIWLVRQEATAVKKYKCTGTVDKPKIDRY